MERKPDMIRAVVLIFFIGLAITGLTSIQFSDDDRQVSEPAADAPLVSFFAD
ncbi:hypothetical protein [Marinobacter caseinilyticus]|uniref:hypothetical protein n=1 Tax=Marinobacter caseinilyticus TaxID=2692195 RepID=UPI00140A853E|nr:hypothetical protein [Marinobacter caseinilyticus]